MIHIRKPKRMKILIYMISFMLMVTLLISNPYETESNFNSLKPQLLMATQYQLSNLSIGSTSSNKINLDLFYRADTFLKPTLLYTCNLIENDKYMAYEHLRISKLFIILEKLLLPKHNSSKYKASAS